MNVTISINPNKIYSNSNETSFKGAPSNLWTIDNKMVKNAFKKMGSFSTPQNRLFMGATALALQPAIDLHNKDVDEKTRKISAARTIAKIAIGTLTGIVVRQGCINWMSKFTCTEKELAAKIKNEEKISKLAKMFVPNGIKPEDFQNAERLLKKHRQALGSIVALGVMLFTNFIIDAPLTRIFTNGLIDEFVQSDLKNNVKGDK